MEKEALQDGARVVTRCDADAVFELRAKEYARAAEFEMTRPELLAWGEHDDAGTIVGVWQGGRLVATLRALVIPDRAAAEDVFACTVDLPGDMFPALMFGRGATDAALQRQGINALLRLYFLRALAADDDRIRCSIALPYEGAPRINLLRALGYELSRPVKTWDPEAREMAPALLAVLPRVRFESARARLETLCVDNVRRFPWIGAPLRLPIDAPSFA